MNGRTDGRTKVPLCSTGLSPLRGRCPKSAFESIFAKEKYFCPVKYDFGFSRHSDRRTAAEEISLI